MATIEYKARALFDFLAEGPSELNLNAGEIVIITSGTDGNDWWYAQNSAGQFGAIPATYVEIIADEANPTQQLPPSDLISDENSNTNYQPRLEEERQEFMTSTPINNGSTSEPRLSIDDQLNQSTEQDFTTDSSFDSLSSPTMNDNLLDATPITSDPHQSTIDSSITSTIINPSPTNNTVSDQQHVLSSNFGQTTFTHEQQNSLLGDLTLSSPVSKNDYNHDAPSSHLVPSSSSELNKRSSSLGNDLHSDDCSATTTKSSKSKNASLPPTKNKPEKTKLFTLRRQKPKADTDKRRQTIENTLEVSATHSKEDSDSDSFPDPGSRHNSLSNPNKHSTGSGDTKSLSRAKIFDKHGISNYLLHDCKSTPDESVTIAYNENEGGFYWSPNPNVPPFTCKIEDPSKGKKLGGLKSFMEYKIHPEIPESRVVGRRYKQFDWLHEQLVNKYRFICIPPLPGKQIAGRYEHEFIEERRRQLELWLNRICRHPVLCASFPVQHFISCELTEKNNKDWKAGKRKTEKDELREMTWLHCVTCADSNLTDSEIAFQIETFAHQQPGLDTHLKSLHHDFTKYLEKQTEVYGHDIQRVGELFTKLHTVVQADKTTPGNDEVSNSMLKVSESYDRVAELYKTKGCEGIRDFSEHIQEYIGLLACFPMILHIQRSTTEFLRSTQQRSGSTTSDLTGAIHRNKVLNHVVLAEINFFQKQKVNDLKLYMKSLMDDQTQFYGQISTEFHDAMSTFK